jgi:hypothetical protein
MLSLGIYPISDATGTGYHIDDKESYLRGRAWYH